MTIVASNSVTVSNVNDGTITHTAWSYSADGTDRFTTVYPNLNLGDNTKTFVGAEGGNNLSGSIIIDPATQKTQDGDINYLTYKPTTGYTDWFHFFLIPYLTRPNMTKVAVKPITKYTFSVWAKGSGEHNIYAYNNWTSQGDAQKINLTSNWTLYTCTVTSSNSIPAENVQFFIRSNAGTEINLKYPKVEEGPIATPWMPSQSEVKPIDYPTFRGEYSDNEIESSNDYKKYSWTVYKGEDSRNYKAWSWSSDGSDRFTTVYPNLNLLINSSAKTKDGFFKNFDKVENDYGEVTIKGTNTWVSRIMWDGFSIQPRDYKPNDKYTMSMDVMFTSWNLPAGTTIGEFWIGQRYSKSTDGSINSWKQICYIDLPKDPSKMLNQWIRITQTSTIPPYADPSVNTEARFMTRFIGTSEGSFTVRVRKPKQEPGPIATPWMPSESEYQDDWSNAVPKYIGYGGKNSQNPNDYDWEIDSSYTDAKTVVNQTQISQMSQDLSGFKTTVSSTYLTTSNASNLYPTKDAVAGTYLNKTDATNLYPTKSTVTSQINQKATDITSSVQSWTNDKLTGYSTIQQTNNSIASAVTDKADKSQITQLSNQITSKVSVGDVTSQINQEAGKILIQADKLVLSANTTVVEGDAFITGDMLVDETIKAKQLDVEKISSVSNDLGAITGGSYSSWDIDDYDTPEGWDKLYRMTGIFMDRGRSRYLTVITSMLNPFTPIIETSSVFRIEGNMQTGLGYRGIKVLGSELTTDYIGQTLDDILKNTTLFIEDSDENQLYDVETRVFHNEVGGTSGLILGADQINIGGSRKYRATEINVYGDIDTYGTNGLLANGRSISRRATIEKPIYYSTNWEFRRIGDVVYVDIPRQMRNYTVAQEEASIPTTEYIPSGFRPAYNHSFGVNANVGTKVVNDVVFNMMANTGQIKVTNTTTGNKIVQGSTSYITNDPFPSQYKKEKKIMVKNINGDIYSDLITSHRDEIYGTNGTVGVNAKKFIVIHGVAGTNINTVFSMWYSNVNPNGREASANYVVDDTQIVGCVGEQASAWHCGGTGVITNQNSIGIEHVNSYIGDINDASTYLFSEATINNGARLTAEICKRLGLTPDANTIVPHRAVYATACPQSLDMNDYIRRVVAFYNGSQPSGGTPQPAPAPAPKKLSAIQQFKNAGNKYVVSASFNVSQVTNHNGIWQLLSSDLLGGTLSGASWNNNGIPLTCINFTDANGNLLPNQTWTGKEKYFKFSDSYNHGTIDAYDTPANAVGIDFSWYGRIWFNADAWLNG